MQDVGAIATCNGIKTSKTAIDSVSIRKLELGERVV